MIITPGKTNASVIYKLSMPNTKCGAQCTGPDDFYRRLSAAGKTIKGNSPIREIDFEYNTEEELLEQISIRFNMEKLKPWELCQILGMLRDGGVISSDEYWLGQAVIPVMDSTSDFPRPKEFENALKDYYLNFETFVENNAHLYPTVEAQKLHDSVLVHKKMEAIFHQIQSYR